jgi:hypothetical protein
LERSFGSNAPGACQLWHRRSRRDWLVLLRAFSGSPPPFRSCGRAAGLPEPSGRSANESSDA